MPIIISGRGVVLTAPFKAMVERKVARLDRLLPRRVEARVILQGEKFRRTARLVVRAARRSFSSQATARDLRVAVDVALEVLRRQLRDDKTRRRQPRGRVAEPVLGPDPEDVNVLDRRPRVAPAVPEPGA